LELPLFPLPQAVLFPGARLPLHVFEPRYRQMTRDVLAGHGCMAIVQLAPDAPASRTGQPAIAHVAGLGAIIEAHELPDGRFNVLLEGRARVSIEELAFVPPYRRARASVIEDSAREVRAIDASSLRAVAHSFISLVASRNADFRMTLPANLPPARLADLCAQHLVLDGSTRQRLLEERDPAARVAKVAEVLAAQLAAARGAGEGTLN
jgi:ATP-dependent Lon protease